MKVLHKILYISSQLFKFKKWPKKPIKKFHTISKFEENEQNGSCKLVLQGT